jgi:group I intron endonuclease
LELLLNIKILGIFFKIIRYSLLFLIIFFICYYEKSGFNLEIFCFNEITFLSSVLPAIKYYENADKYKKLAIKENKEKAGIYRILNKKSGDFYIGSSIDIGNRLNQHLYLASSGKFKGNSKLYNAVFKYGLENFSLEILEYCSLDQLLNREQYFMDLLKPKYNILKQAYSFQGFTHSEYTKKHLSKIKTGLKFTKEQKNKMSKAAIERLLSQISLDQLSAAQKAGWEYTSIQVQILNLETNEKKCFDSIKQSANYLNCDPSALRYAIKKNTLYKKIYQITKI